MNKTPERQALRAFIAAYIDCALWSSTAYGAPDMGEDDDTSMESYGYTHDDIAPVSKRAIIRECIDFYEANEATLVSLCADHRADDTTLGHDFWLTRNRHGAGFWDRGYGKRGDVLTKAAHAYGECSPYVGDDEKVYFP